VSVDKDAQELLNKIRDKINRHRAMNHDDLVVIMGWDQYEVLKESDLIISANVEAENPSIAGQKLITATSNYVEPAVIPKKDFSLIFKELMQDE